MYGADDLDADHRTQAPRLTDLNHAEKLRAVLREGRRANAFGSFPVTENSPRSDCLSVLSPVVDVELAVPLLFHYRLPSSYSEQNRCILRGRLDKLCKRSSCAIFSRKHVTLITNKITISILQVLSEASSAGNHLFFKNA